MVPSAASGYFTYSQIHKGMFHALFMVPHVWYHMYGTIL